MRGKQDGRSDHRNGFPVFIKAVEEVKPKLWLFENVRGLLYKNKRYLYQIIRELEALGYVVSIKLLNAVDYGIPQNRERVIVVGHHGNFEFPNKLHGKVTAGEALGDLAFQYDPTSRFLTPQMDAYVARYEKASYCKVPRDLHLHNPARTLTCRNLAGTSSSQNSPTKNFQTLLLTPALRIGCS